MMMNVCFLPQKPLSKGLTLTETKASWKGSGPHPGPGELAESPPPLAVHTEGWAIPEFTARVVVCVQNWKQTRASCSQMWGLSGSLTIPGVLGVKAAHARSCFSPGNTETGDRRNLITPPVPKMVFLSRKRYQARASPRLLRKCKCRYISICCWISDYCSEADKSVTPPYGLRSSNTFPMRWFLGLYPDMNFWRCGINPFYSVERSFLITSSEKWKENSSFPKHLIWSPPLLHISSSKINTFIRSTSFWPVLLFWLSFSLPSHLTW